MRLTQEEAPIVFLTVALNLTVLWLAHSAVVSYAPSQPATVGILPGLRLPDAIEGTDEPQPVVGMDPKGLQLLLVAEASTVLELPSRLVEMCSTGDYSCSALFGDGLSSPDSLPAFCKTGFACKIVPDDGIRAIRRAVLYVDDSPLLIIATSDRRALWTGPVANKAVDATVAFSLAAKTWPQRPSPDQACKSRLPGSERWSMSARDFPLRRLHDLQETELSQWVGRQRKPTVISIWATWCGPCVEEIAALQDLQAANASVLLVGIVETMHLAGLDDDAKKARQLLVEKGGTYPNYIAVGAGIDGSALKRTLNLGPALPVFALFDGRGELFDRLSGPIAEAGNAKKLARFLTCAREGRLAHDKEGSL